MIFVVIKLLKITSYSNGNKNDTEDLFD